MELKLKAGQFYGKTAQALDTRGFRFTEKMYSTSTALPVHAHELAHFCFVLSGNYEERIGSTLFRRESNAIVYYPSDLSHSEAHLTTGRHFLVEINGSMLESLREYGARLDAPVGLSNSDAGWLAVRMYREFRERDNFSGLALESISTELLVAASRQVLQTAERQPPSWLKRVKEFLNENFSMPPSLNELATVGGVHPTHLARVFRQFEQCTISDYIRRIRIERACQEMISSKETLVDIALNTGFADQTHFTRSFRRMTGMTPTEFRNIFKSR